MELRRYFSILLSRWLLIGICILAGIGGAYLGASHTAKYRARSTIYVGVRQFTAYDAGLYANVQVAGLDRIIATFADMIDSQPIAQAALTNTRAERSVGQLLSETSVDPQPNTQLIRINVVDPDPGVAQQLANAVADAFVNRIESFEPGAAPKPGDVPQLPANVFERASLPTVPQPSGVAKRVILGGLFGFVAAIGIGLLLEYLDITIKDQADAERRLGLPVLGVIPFDRRMPASPTLEREPVGAGSTS